jgi:hypothetical protein
VRAAGKIKDQSENKVKEAALQAGANGKQGDRKPKY